MALFQFSLTMAMVKGPAGAVISGIERWTDGLKWGPSRVRDDFLFYQEKDANDRDSGLVPHSLAIKA
jgi:hypothetical protein